MDAQSPLSYNSATDQETPDQKLALVLPRVLIVSRRTVRKNKFVDFVGEYHLDLIVKYGAVPIIVPRVSGLHLLLDSFEPIHGVLLCEGEDVDPALYESGSSSLTAEELEAIKNLHSSDSSIDKQKDSIEMQLAKRCLERKIPYLGICRGSQILNVASGGSLYQDVERELAQKGGVYVKHMNYEDYDGHRHPINVIEGTPLHDWFQDSLQTSMQLNVNSYHHQGVRRLASRFSPMAFSPCGLIEAFYDPDVYKPEEGKFLVGLQFHPERMRHEHDVAEDHGACSVHETVFDYPGCVKAYQEFVTAVIAYQKDLLGSRPEEKRTNLDGTLEKQRMKLVRSFSFAKDLYEERLHLKRNKSLQEGLQYMTDLQSLQSNDTKCLEAGAKFLQSTNVVQSAQQKKRLEQVGATICNSSKLFERLCHQEDREAKAKTMLERLGTSDLHDLQNFYKIMVVIISEILERRTKNST